MKTTVIRMLDYPRSLLRRNVELHDCPHAGQFADTDARCRLCEFTMECHWLCQNDEFVALGEKSIDKIVEALSFALGYVDAETTKWGHRHQNCRCEACTWLRNAHRLYDKVHGDACILASRLQRTYPRPTDGFRATWQAYPMRDKQELS